MALTGPGWLGAHLLRQVTRSVGRGERVRPCRKQPNLGTEGLACVAVEGREHLGLCCPQLVIQGREELDAELRRDDSARPPVAGIGTTLDQLGRLEIVEEVSHDRSIDSEVLGEGKLARHRALSRGGKDLVAPRTARKVGDRGARGQGVRPQDNTQAPAEVACQRADAAWGCPNLVAVTKVFIHHPIIADKALFERSSARLMICDTYS